MDVNILTFTDHVSLRTHKSRYLNTHGKEYNVGVIDWTNAIFYVFGENTMSEALNGHRHSRFYRSIVTQDIETPLEKNTLWKTLIGRSRYGEMLLSHRSSVLPLGSEWRQVGIPLPLFSFGRSSRRKLCMATMALPKAIVIVNLTLSVTDHRDPMQ
ncbi:hypothetical protein V6N11_008531 [Hibiscus sabdariffa]|uniref:Uncharacterized protein n=1 Tax=Hibiscus sabdariffa TaxID=183260 RepID=A0ABR2PNL9_9ROSI